MGFKPRPNSSNPFPFPYLNHGSLMLESMGRCDGAYLGFVDTLPAALRQEIRNTCPAPIRGSASFLDNMLSIESPGDVFDVEVLECYGTEAEKAASQDWATFGQETADRFAADVERWALHVHSIAPLAFFMGPCSAYEDDPWNRWSKQVFAERFVPFIDAFIERNPSILEDREDDDDLNDIAVFSYGDVACLLQEFEPEHALVVPAELQSRVESLCETFTW